MPDEVGGWGRARGPVPRVRTAGGGDGCRRSVPIPVSRGRAERDEPRLLARLHPHQHGALALGAGSLSARCARRPGLATVLPRDLEDHVAGLEAWSAAIPLGSTSVTTTPSPPLPATWPAGARVRPSRGTSVAPGLSPSLSSRARASRWLRQFAERHVTVFSSRPCAARRASPSCRAPCAPIFLARSRASLTGSPLTEVMTSPA